MAGAAHLPTAKTHLLVIAHGSRRQASNDEVRGLVQRLRVLLGPATDNQACAAVEVAFLELAEPSIAEGLSRCVARGAGNIVVFPYFLAAGTHVARDIPEAMAAFQAEHPHIAIHLSRHLGASQALPWAILEMAAAGAAPRALGEALSTAPTNACQSIERQASPHPDGGCTQRPGGIPRWAM